MKRHAKPLTHLHLALRAVRAAATELRYSLSLEVHSAVQRELLSADLRDMHGTIATLVQRRRRARDGAR